MTGLDKILKAIEAQADAVAGTVIAEAQKEADEILAAAKLEAEQKCAQIAEKSDADVKAILARGESAAALQERKVLLDAKQQIISNIIAEARKKLANLPETEYTDILLKMVKKYAHKKPGKILFSSSDKNRLPKDIETRLKAALADKEGADLTVCEEYAPLEGGFLLIYGDIEENCSFDAMFAEAREELSDKVNSFLFD